MPQCSSSLSEDVAMRISMMKDLLAAGAKFTSTNIANTSALHCACYCGSLRMVTEVLKITPPNEINVESSKFGTPIYAAAFRGWHNVVQKLLDAGANPELGWKGESPETAARKLRHRSVVRIFRKDRNMKLIKSLDSRSRMIMFPWEPLGTKSGDNDSSDDNCLYDYAKDYMTNAAGDWDDTLRSIKTKLKTDIDSDSSSTDDDY